MASTESESKPIEHVLQIASCMWKQVKDLVKNKPEFAKIDDQAKLKFFSEELKHDEFMKEFPIVTRYMICMGQYSQQAFRRMLEKIRLQYKNMPPPEKRERNYMQEEWIKRQADYVRFLWEAYQKGHFDRRMGQIVWDDAYKKLKGEFDDFKNKYEDVQKQVDTEKKQLKGEFAKDLLERLKTGTQHLEPNDEAKLLEQLRRLACKRRFSNCLLDLLAKTPRQVESCSGTGRGSDQPAPVIKMVETVDEDRMDEIPDAYKM